MSDAFPQISKQYIRYGVTNDIIITALGKNVSECFISYTDAYQYIHTYQEGVGQTTIVSSQTNQRAYMKHTRNSIQSILLEKRPLIIYNNNIQHLYSAL